MTNEVSAEVRLSPNCDLIKCPVSWQVFRHPIAASDGHIYELKSLYETFRSSGSTFSPKLGSSTLITHVDYLYPLKQSLDTDLEYQDCEDRYPDYDKHPVWTAINELISKKFNIEMDKLHADNLRLKKSLKRFEERNDRLFLHVMELQDEVTRIKDIKFHETLDLTFNICFDMVLGVVTLLLAWRLFAVNSEPNKQIDSNEHSKDGMNYNFDLLILAALLLRVMARLRDSADHGRLRVVYNDISNRFHFFQRPQPAPVAVEMDFDPVLAAAPLL